MSNDREAAIDAAAIWLAAHWWEAPRPLIPSLKRKFGLSAKEAIEVIRAASDAREKGWQP